MNHAGKGWIRVSGTLIEDDSMEVREIFIDRNPSAKKMYRADDGNMVVFYFSNVTAHFCNFGKPVKEVKF